MPILSNMPGGMDTSDATATPADIVSGKTAYANGIKVTGTYDVMEHMRDYCENGAHIELTATVGDNTLHLRTQTGGYDCVILWGDGAATRAPVDGGNVIHNYAEAGAYHIYIVGRSFAGFYVNNQTGGSKYTAAHSMGRWEKDTMTDLRGCFQGCTNLTTLHSNLFQYNTKVTNFAYCFYRCYSLTNIPIGLFQYNTAATSFSNTFDECTSLTAIPTDLFRYNTEAKRFDYCFQRCTSLTTIPANLFQYNTKAPGFPYCFSRCTSLTAIPADPFRYNTAATSFSNTFDGCTSLTAIPADLFRYNTEAKHFYYSFRDCTKLSLRSDIFGTDYANRFAGKTINFSECFKRTSFSGTKGTAPQLWNFTFGSVTSTGCFGGAGNSATSLTNYADIPAAWK